MLLLAGPTHFPSTPDTMALRSRAHKHDAIAHVSYTAAAMAVDSDKPKPEPIGRHNTTSPSPDNDQTRQYLPVSGRRTVSTKPSYAEQASRALANDPPPIRRNPVMRTESHVTVALPRTRSKSSKLSDLNTDIFDIDEEHDDFDSVDASTLRPRFITPNTIYRSPFETTNKE